MTELFVSYNEIIQLRRDSMLKYRHPSTIYYDKVSSSEYVLYMNDGNIVVKASATGSDFTDFENNKKSYCNRILVPDGVSLRTHDYADNTTWVHGTSNSLYRIAPTTGKMIKVLKFIGIVDNGISIGAGSEFNVVVWESYDDTTACSAYVSGTKTAFGTPAYNPPTVQTGWLKVHPPSGDPQEVSVWLYLDSNVAKYKATAFRYTSLDEIKYKSSWRIDGNAINSVFDYKSDDINILLRDSLNERIEIYIEDDTAYTDPNGEGAVMTATFSSYDEW